MTHPKFTLLIEFYNVLVLESAEAWLRDGKIFHDGFLEFSNFLIENSNHFRMILKDSFFSTYPPAHFLQTSTKRNWEEFLHDDLDFGQQLITFDEFIRTNSQENINAFKTLLERMEWYNFVYPGQILQVLSGSKPIIITNRNKCQTQTDLESANPKIILIKSGEHTLRTAISELSSLLTEDSGHEKVCQSA